MFKKSILAFLGCAISGFASAGTMGPLCIPANVTVPCEAQHWDLGIQALYLQSVYSATKAYQHTQNDYYHGINNQWDSGYRLTGAYHFNTGNDLSMNWMHFSSLTNQGNLTGSIPSPFGGMVLNQAFNLAGEDRLDQVNILLGQLVDFGLIDKMRFFGGLQYAHLQTNVTNYFSTVFTKLNPADPDLAFTSVNQFDNTEFKGLGPIIGIDYALDISRELSVTAHSSGSILYGTSRYSNGYVGAPFGLVVSSLYGKTRVIVPGLDTKLGMNYAYSLMQGVLNFEGGYQALNYFNIIQTQTLADISSPITTSYYGLYGPYFGLKYVGNV